MAQLVLGAAGAVIGFYATGGNPYGAQVGFAAGAALGGAYEMRKKRIDGPRLTDLKVPGTEYGDPIPWLIGNQRMPGIIAWASEKREVATTTRQGKGGGPKVTTYTYEIDLLIVLNEEAGTGTRLQDISRIWSNGKIVRNRLTGASAETLSTVFREDLWRRLTVYDGNENQLPDPTYEAAVGAGDAPAYRGRGSVFIEGLQLDGSGQLPLLTFEVLTAAASSIEDAAFTDVDITTASYIAAGTLAINSSDVDQYVIAIGTWDTGYSTTVVNVYGISLEATFVNSRFGGEVVTPVTSLGTFNVNTAAVAAGHGNSDVPLFVQNEGSATSMFTYTVPAGVRTTYTCNEVAYQSFAADVRFCQSGTAMVFGHGTGGSKKLHRFVVNTGNTCAIAVSSAALADYVNSIAIVGDRVYAAAKTSKVVYILDLATLTLQDTIDRPSAATANPDVWPLLFEFNGQLGLIGNISATVDYRVWTLNDDEETWTLLGGALGPTFVTTSNYGQSVGVVGSLLVSGVIVGTSPYAYNTWTAPITLTPAPATLQEAVEALCARSGLQTTQYDATSLSTITTPVRSAAMTQVEGVRGLLEQLRIAHGFECSLSDKLYFRPRGAATVRTIAYDDLGAGEEAAADEPLPLNVGADLELPPQVSVQFLNASNDYQAGTEHSDRIVLSTQVATQQVQLGLAMTPAEAKAVADRLNAEAAMGLVTTSIALTLDHADLEPGDAIAATTADGEAIRFRLGRKNDAGGVVSFEAVRDDASLQVTNGSTDTDYTEGTTVTAASLTLWQLLDIPLLRDADDGPGYVAAAKGVSTTWPGAQIQTSANGVDYTAATTVSESAVFGYCTSTLGDFAGGSAMFDETNRLTVNVGFGELSSSTREGVLNDTTVNALRVGDEIIRFVTATQTGSNPNTYRLSRLLRGQLGTEWAIDGHVADEECTLLRTLGGLRNVLTQASDIGQLRYVKGVTLGTSAAAVTADEFTDTGIKLKPYAPLHLRVHPDTAGTTVQCSWERRTRYSYRWPSTTAMPVGETAEAYEIDVLTGEVVGADAWNPADKDADISLSGSDTIASITANFGAVRSSVFRNASDNVYCEITLGGTADGTFLPGIGTAAASIASAPGGDINGRGIFGQDGKKYDGGAGVNYSIAFTSGDVIGIWMNDRSLSFSVNGADQGVAFTGLVGEWAPMWGPGNNTAGTRTATLNLGATPFLYRPEGARAWGADPFEVVQALTSTTNSIEITSGSSLSGNIVRVYQISSVVGRGYVAEATIP